MELDLSTNLNPWGTPERVREALASVDPAPYPDPSATAPRQAAAGAWGTSPREILFGAGASELIHLAARALVGRGHRALVPAPAFGEYSRAVQLAGGKVDTLPLDPDSLRLPMELIESQVRMGAPRLVFLCHPHAPTGEAIPPEGLARVADALPPDGFLLLDESYRSFADGAFLPPLLRSHPRVLHLRSITKDFALAGIRAGFAAGPRGIIDAMARLQPPWSASAPAQAAAVAALSPEGTEQMVATLPAVAAERERLARELAAMGWAPLPSRGSFLLSRVPGAREVRHRLRREGIRVRGCESFGLPGHLRIGIPRPQGGRRLLAALGTAR